MMRYHGRKHARRGERGVTMIIVAIAMFSMLAMVALAVDVITLYSARSEAQRAADAAALAAAQMLVNAGVTGDPTNGGLQTTAQGFATTIAQNAAQQAVISGQQVQAANVATTFGPAASFGVNPTVTVTVQSATLPTFFSRIWSHAALTVSASATAEAFNPSNSSSIGGTGVPIVARCVKPFLLPNCDPGGTLPCGTTFFDTTAGAMTRPGQTPGGILGEQFVMQANCGAGPGCAPGAPQAGQYYPAAITGSTPNACPSTCGGGTAFEQSIECCNPTPLTCSTTLGTGNTLQVDTTVDPDGGAGSPAQSGLQCLTHQTPGNGQDILNENVLPGPLTYPLQIQAGNNHPLEGTPSLATGDYITTSDSLVTVPVYDNVAAGGAPGATGVQIIGFLQVFVNNVWPGGGGPKQGSFTVTVVNVSGCGSNATGTPVYNGSSAAVPVRLIHQ
jgi:Flp pilus assembly protein TadG